MRNKQLVSDRFGKERERGKRKDLAVCCQLPVMSLKIKDFGNFSEENVSGRGTKEEIRLSPEDDYDPPPPRRSHEDRNRSGSSRRSDSRRRSNSRSPSRGPRFGDVPRYRDQKPFFGPRDHEGNIQVNYIRSSKV